MIGHDMKKFDVIEHEDYIEIQNHDGRTLGISKKNKQKLIEVDGWMFKNLSESDELEPYADWRLSSDERADDLAKKLEIKQIAGLMLYSRHQTVSKNSNRYAKLFGTPTYNGKRLEESDASITDLTDQQKSFLKEDGVRHVLISSVDSKEECAHWANQIQAYCENIGFGIPVNLCSDPRHGIKADAEYNLGSGSDISQWPEEIGLAATFDPDLVQRFATILSKEYRGLGISTSLSPQIDLATDPRWRRYTGTFGECCELCKDMAKAYCDGAQSSSFHEEIENGWGWESVNTMVKHWPGGGSGEGGRDAHYAYGKYAVYPGNNFEEHLKPFTEGAFDLDGKTKKASAVMPYYTISYDQDRVNHENVGNSYSHYIIQDLLRDRYQYDGVVCTDWLITADHGPTIGTFSGKCWGVENLSVTERHLKALEAGVDQFGGNQDIKPVLEAYHLMKEKYGKEFTDTRFRLSASRILKNMFRIGLFDQPYVDVEKTKRIVGCSQFNQEGYEAQLKSAILLKNKKDVLPMAKKKKVYIPNQVIKERIDWFGNKLKGEESFPLDKGLLSSYYELVEDPNIADFAIVYMTSPISDGYVEKDGKGEYIPITLQYRPYQCKNGRKMSIANGDPLEKTNRSYFGKNAICENEHELDILMKTRNLMGNKPIICCLHMKKPCIISEIESVVDGLLIHFGIQNQAILDLISGSHEPSGLLPFQIPKNMETVEKQNEDVPFDMEVYVDEEGNKYDFAYGRNYKGIIQDQRIRHYRK